MRLTCPYCGERDHAEFTYRGDAAPVRPALRERGRTEAAVSDPAMIDYVYMRSNPAGALRELWQHTGGCRAWVTVTRNVTNHVVAGAFAARDLAPSETVR